MATDKDLDQWAADHRITTVLAAAAAPADPLELAGERQAVAAFLRVRAAAPAVVPTSGPPARAAGTHAPAKKLGKRLRVVLVAGAAVLAAGGVAVAAPAGGIPGLVHHRSSGPGKGPNSGTVTSAPPARTHTPTSAPTSAPATGASSIAPTLAQMMHGRCQSWTSAVEAGKTVDYAKSPYDRLAAAAGGVDKVPAFCAAVLGTPAAHPGHDGTAPPSTSPTPHPTSHPKQSKSRPAPGAK